MHPDTQFAEHVAVARLVTIAGRAEEQTGMGGLRFDTPWGWELVWDVAPDVVGRVFHVRRGHRLWLDGDGRAVERVVVCAGLLILVWEDEHGHLQERTLHPGEVHEIPARTRHRMITVEDAVVLAMSGADVGDLVRVEDG